MTARIERTPRTTAIVAEVVATCAAMAAATHAGFGEQGVLRFTSAVVVFIGAAFPLLLRWSSVSPSFLKLIVLSSVLSPPLVMLLRHTLGVLVGAEQAWPATFLFLAVVQLGVMGRSSRFERLGWAAWGTALLALALACATAALLLGGDNPARTALDGQLWYAGVAQGMLRGGGLENPWLAGTMLEHHPGYAAFLSTLSGALRAPPTLCAAWLAVWAAALLPMLLYFLAAPLWREPRRVLLAPVLALLGWNAWGGLGLWAPAGGGWYASLGSLVPGGRALDLDYGLSALVRCSPGGVTLVYLAAAWMCAAHALRHAARPWVGLTGLLHGIALLLEPTLGLTGILASALCAGSGAHRPGRKVLWALLVGGTPGAYLVWRFGLETAPQLAGSQELGHLRPALMAAGLLLLSALGLIGARWLGPPARDPADELEQEQRDEAGRRCILRLCIFATGVPLLALAVTPAGSTASLARAASLALGVLAAGGLVDLFERGNWGRHAALALGAALTFGGGRALAVAGRAHLELGRLPSDVHEAGAWLEPVFPGEDQAGGDGTLPERVAATRAQVEAALAVRQRHLALAYRWLRDELPLRAAAPILVQVVRSVGQGPVDPNPATLFANLPLWVDRWPEVAPGSARWEPRHSRVEELYHEEGGWDPNLMREFRARGRPVIFLVQLEDRQRTRGAVESKLARVGARELHTEGTVRLFLWSPDEGEGG